MKQRVGVRIISTIIFTLLLTSFFTPPLHAATSQENTARASINALQFRSPLTSTVELGNDQDRVANTSITYLVDSVWGGNIYRQQTSYVVPPHSSRTILLLWQDASWVGVYKVAVKSDNTTLHESYVYIVPRWMLILTTMLIIIGIVYAIRLRR